MKGCINRGVTQGTLIELVQVLYDRRVGQRNYMASLII
jgi:hypothetical protein